MIPFDRGSSCPFSFQFTTPARSFIYIYVYLPVILGTEYRGEFKDGVRQGRGILKSKDGSTFEGQFYNGEKTGKGILTKEGSKKHIYGYWENDNMTRELDKGEIEELIGRKEAGNEDAYECTGYFH